MAIYMLTAKQTLLAQEVRNVLYYSTQDETTAGLQAIVDGLRSAWSANLAGDLVPEWQLYGVDVRKVDVAGQPTIEYAFTSGVLDGAGTGDSVATQVAGLVSFTALTSKPNRARSYLAGLQESALTDSQWGTLILGRMEGWGTDTLDPTGGTITGVARLTVSWDSFHTYVLGGNILTEVRAVPVPGTQRRRRIGIGI